MIKLGMNQLGNVLPLFSDWKHHMCIQAAEEGKVTAEIWVDSEENPQAAVLCFGYRMLIGGDPKASACVEAIRNFLQETILQGRIHFFMIFWHDPLWQDTLMDVLSKNKPILCDREYYSLELTDDCAPCRLPQGYILRPVNQEFINEKEWQNKKPLLYEMCSERVSVEDFLQHSFGVCAVNGEEITGWCLSEYNHSKGCEVGIEVQEGHQHRGIGTNLTLALAAEAKKQGMQTLGWSSFTRNIPSTATARKAGLTRAEEYKAIIVEI